VEANYKTADGRIVFKVAGESPKVLFKEIAAIQDLFEAESSCGCCDGTNLRFQLRTAGERGEFDYYELVCKNTDCRARFSFGQSKDQKSLFPKRKDDQGAYLPNRGWSRYQRPGTTGAPTQDQGGW
jgi:hypothetical protein